MRQCLFVPLLLLSFATSAAHACYIPLCLGELADWADLIVVGEARVDGQTGTIRVRQTLKGPQNQSVRLSTSFKGDQWISEGMDGVFLLQENPKEQRYYPFHPGSHQPIARLDRLKRVLDMFRDPAPFVAAAKPEEMQDLVYILGQLFLGYRIDSPQIPALTKSKSSSVFWAETAPWRSKDKIEVECTFNAGPDRKLTVAPRGSLRDTDPLYHHLRHRLLTAVNWPDVAQDLPERFTVTLDARIPEKIGGLTAADAACYLRESLESQDPSVVVAALTALAKMRDLDAVPAVIRLVDHEQEQVATRAIRLLGRAQDKRATPALRKAMLAPRPHGYHLQPDSAAVALGLIGDTDAVPDLQAAARRGVENACAALAQLGNTDSFLILLETAEAKPTMFGSQSGMYLLVCRSNKSPEPWMNASSESGETLAAKVPQWRKWWQANGEDFKITRTWREVVEP